MRTWADDVPAANAVARTLTSQSASVPSHVRGTHCTAFVQVNEAGTEAAAATAIMMVTAVFRPMPDPEFRADRPFVFAIWERVSRSILFVGQCVAPHDAE